MQGFPNDILQNIRKHLEEEKTRRTSRITELEAQDPISDPTRLNDNAASDTEASEESSHDRFHALVVELKAGLDDINNALGRIGNGTYGYCTNCRDLIDTDRLAIIPTATLCLTCEAKRKHT